MKHITRVEGSITKEREDLLSHTHLLLREEARRLEMRALMYPVTWAPETGARKGKIRRIVLPFWLARTKSRGLPPSALRCPGDQGMDEKEPSVGSLA